MSKKLLIIPIITIGLAFSFYALAEYSPKEGELIKTQNYPAVYYVGASSTRSLFPNADTFWTWNKGSWKDQQIQVVTTSTLEKLTSGPNIKVRPGVKLIKFDNSPDTIYAVRPNGKLCKLADKTVAAMLFGADWEKKVILIQGSFEADYEFDKNCVLNKESKYPDGTYLRFGSSTDIWHIEEGKLVKMSSSTFDQNNLPADAIIIISKNQAEKIKSKFEEAKEEFRGYLNENGGVLIKKLQERKKEINEKINEIRKKYKDRLMERFQKQESESTSTNSTSTSQQ